MFIVSPSQQGDVKSILDLPIEILTDFVLIHLSYKDLESLSLCGSTYLKEISDNVMNARG